MITDNVNDNSRWEAINHMLSRPTPFGNETGKLPMGEFEACQGALKKLRTTTKILLVGAGGLGCEILKDLALSGITDIHVIDLDTIDVSNLNRQFLFRQKDVGRGKAEVAAEVIMARVPGCSVIPYMKRIQEFDTDFFKQFTVIISGLDNIEARRWLNCTLVGMVVLDEDNEPIPETIIPFIDGGTEGFRGQARVIIPKITSCFECSIDSFPPQTTFQLCTLANTPRIPEHCIAYAMTALWEKEFGDKKLDSDDPSHLQWICEKAQARAKEFGIAEVTYFKTIGVVKNIIPAVASTNAIISAICVAEALKIITYFSQSLNTYFMYMGSEGLYTSTFEYARKGDCLVCSDELNAKKMSVSKDMLLKDFIQLLADLPEYQFKKPSLRGRKAGQPVSLYCFSPKSLEEQTRPNLERCLHELHDNDEIISITDPSLVKISTQLQIIYDEN